MKTDLGKIMTVSGHHGLYRFICQTRGGVLAESLEQGKKVSFDMHSRITTLADIAIYTNEGEMKLQEVFTAMKAVCDNGTPVPGAKGEDEALKSFFAQAVPEYDSDRFYVSHMRKVALWYDELEKHASLDFGSDGEEEKKDA